MELGLLTPAEELGLRDLSYMELPKTSANVRNFERRSKSHNASHCTTGNFVLVSYFFLNSLFSEGYALTTIKV